MLFRLHRQSITSLGLCNLSFHFTRAQREKIPAMTKYSLKTKLVHLWAQVGMICILIGQGKERNTGGSFKAVDTNSGGKCAFPQIT